MKRRTNIMGRKYRNPPIVEAVCEFRLTPDTPWDLTIPGLFFEKVKSTFTQREQRVIQEVELSQEPQGLQQQIRTTERILLFTQDKKMLVQLGPRLLVVNALKPYPTWQRFKPLIETAWEGLKSVLEVRGLQRIGLRYINRIELPVPVEFVGISEYFAFYPFVGPQLPRNMVSFIIGGEFPYKEGRDRCRVQLTPAPDSGDKSAFMLDIDYFLARSREIEVGKALDWVEEAHSQVEAVFEGCITDVLRKMFEEVK
ncbi:MAG: TIGR04255 family protein [Deltaproteobacteria bacterium]|nr:MAG: TIGR04255 family protein [Deltaproteobacteria bacterium]